MMHQTVSLMLATLCIVAIYVTKGSRLSGFRLLMLISASGLLLDYAQNALQLFDAPYAVSMMFALGPGYYLFLHSLLRKPPPIYKIALHALPTLISLPFVHHTQWLIFLGSLSQLIYLLFALLLSRRYHFALVQQTSDAYTHEIRWVFWVLWIFLMTVVLDLVRLNLQIELGPALNSVWQMIGNLISILLVAFLLKQLIYHNKVFPDWETLTDAPKMLNSENALQIFLEVKQHVLNNQLYLIPRLTVRDISEQIGLNEKDISWAVNRGGNLSFNDFINQLRVEHFKQNLTHTKHSKANVLDVAFSSGFNSKSSFNAVFKKHTGLTPTAYIKTLG